LSKMSNSGSANPFPDRVRTVFSSELFGTVTAGVASGTYTVGLNNIYLPWNTGTAFPNPITFATATLQPAGLTSFLSATAAYRTYMVVSSRITVVFRPGTFADEIMMAVAPIVAGTAYGTCAEMTQGPFSRSSANSSQTNYQSGTLFNKIAVANYFGNLSLEEVRAEDNYQALYNGTPVNNLLWQVTFATFTGTNLAGKLNYRVNIYWEVELSTQSGPTLPDLMHQYVDDKSGSDSKLTYDSKESKSSVSSDVSSCADLGSFHMKDSASVYPVMGSGGKFIWIETDQKEKQVSSSQGVTGTSLTKK